MVASRHSERNPLLIGSGALQMRTRQHNFRAYSPRHNTRPLADRMRWRDFIATLVTCPRSFGSLSIDAKESHVRPRLARRMDIDGSAIADDCWRPGAVCRAGYTGPIVPSYSRGFYPRPSAGRHAERARSRLPLAHQQGRTYLVPLRHLACFEARLDVPRRHGAARGDGEQSNRARTRPARRRHRTAAKHGDK